MSHQRHRRARELFEAAIDLPPDEISQYLDSACGGDDRLRCEVERLLEVDCELEQASSPPPVPHEIGNFRVIRLIGEGGMGEVWEAEQKSPVQRRAAIKLVKWGMDTREVLARFEAERQALAWMSHPNIAGVFDAGATAEGRPFFAMEFVQGVDITSYSDTHRLSIADRLRLFVEVCNGVQHAHQKGVIHRDLKPSNVLVTEVDGEAVPKIIDFGVAKAMDAPLTDRTIKTSLGNFIGTPFYMSPEQAAADSSDVDTRSDVYSLGVLLCELLVGMPPLADLDHREVALDEVWRRIREDEPRRPSTLITRASAKASEFATRRRTDVAGLRRAVRGDLDWIVLRALEKDRTRRYGSAAELAADVARHLRHEAVTAGPPSALYRIGKLIRRNRATAIAVLLVIVSMVIAVIGTSHGLLRARREAATARAVSGLLESMIREMNPRSRTGYAATPREIVDRTVDRIQSELGDQPLQVARLMTALGVTYEGFGEFDLARPLFERSADIRLEILGRNHLDFAESLTHLGNLMADIGDDHAALQFHTEALEIRERLCETGDRVLVGSLEHLMISSYYSGDCESVLDIGRRILAAADPADIAGRSHLETAVVTTGTAAKLCGDHALALAMLERSAVLEGGFSGPENLGMARSLINYAGFLDLMGRPEQASPHAIRGLEIWEKQGGPHDRSYATAVDAAATIMLHLGRLEAAAGLYDRVIAMVGESGVPMPDHEITLYNSACALAGLDRREPALDRLHKAVDLGFDDPAKLDDPALASLRGLPEFQALVDEVRRRTTNPPD